MELTFQWQPVLIGISMSISHVSDTYAKAAQGRIMYFDGVLDEKNAAKALGYAKTWLDIDS